MGKARCPHGCGHLSGYQTNVVLQGPRVYDWDGDLVDTDLRLKSEGRPVCGGCKKPVGRFLKNGVLDSRAAK